MKIYILLILSAFLSLSNINTQAQCLFDITNIIDDFQNGGGITGEGVADCERVQVIIVCAQELNQINSTNTSTQIVSVSNSSWQATFTNAEIQNIGCNCGSNMFMIVECKGCPQEIEQFTLCDETECPDVSLIVGNISCSDFDTNGNLPVQFNITTSGSTFNLYNVNFGDGNSQTINLPGPSIFVNHIYLCPSSGITFIVDIFAVGCPNNNNHTSNDQIQLQVPLCPCPTVSVIPTSIDECDVNFLADASWCNTSNLQYSWSFGDGGTALTNTSSVSHNYNSDGNYTVTVQIIGIGSNCSDFVDITLNDCEDCVPDCEGKQCGDDGCGGLCGDCPDGCSCVDGACLANGDSDCGFLGLGCISFNLCWILAFFIMLLIAGRLIALANGVGFNWPTSFTLDDILEALGLIAIVVMLALCPCETTAAIIAGVILALIWVIVQLIAGFPPSNWLPALILAIALIISALAYRALECEGQTGGDSDDMEQCE